MEEQEKKSFDQMIDSLKMYQRYELKDKNRKNMEKAWETSFDSLLNKTVTLNKKVPVRVNYTLSGKRGEKNIDAKDKNLIENTNLYKLNLE